METFQGLATGYLQHLAGRASWRNYCNIHQQFFKDWARHPNYQQIYLWHESRRATPDQANKGLAFLKAMYAWGLRSGQYSGYHIALGVRAHSTQSRERVMDSLEIARVLSALDLMPHRLRVLLLILLTTGCRLSEALNMEPAHLNLTTGQWTQYHTKNKRIHITYMPTQARKALAQLGTGRIGYTVDAAEKAWNKVRKDLKLDDVRLHDFRRTWSTHCYRATKDLALVKRCINHASKDVTMVYVRFMFDEVRDTLQGQADRFYGLVTPQIAPSPTLPLMHARAPEVSP